MKDLDKALQSPHEWIVILETRISQLTSLVKYVKQMNKRILLHIDLIQGLEANEYGVEYLAHNIQPDGVVSTRGSVVEMVKKRKMIAVQRLFLLDSLSLDSVRIGYRYQADCIEVLPGKIPEVIVSLKGQTEIPLIAGGLITSKQDIEEAYRAGAIAVSTSSADLW